MALTNAERQAAFKARKAETLDALAQQNAALLAEVAELRAEVDRLREKAHRLEVSALKAQSAGVKRPVEKQPKVKARQGPESDPHQPNARRNDKATHRDFPGRSRSGALLLTMNRGLHVVQEWSFGMP